jgi:hypothetical protein
MTEAVAPPHTNGPSPRIAPGDAQLVTPRRGYRELFPSSWLRTPAKVTYSGEELEGTLLEFCSTGLIMQANALTDVDPGVITQISLASDDQLYRLAKGAGGNRAVLKACYREARTRDNRSVQQLLAGTYDLAAELEATPTADEVDQKANQQMTLVQAQVNAHHFVGAA